MQKRYQLRQHIVAAWHQVLDGPYCERRINSERALQVFFCMSLIEQFKNVGVRSGDLPSAVGVQLKPSYDIDHQFNASTFSGNKDAPHVDWGDKMRTLVWRSEDRRNAYLSHGHAEEDLVHSDEALTFGRGQMLAFVQRGGHIRMDIVNTDAVFEKFGK